MAMLEKLFKIIIGILTLGFAAKIYTTYKKGERSEHKKRVRDLRGKLDEIKKEVSTSTLRDNINRANARVRKLRDGNTTKQGD